MTYVAPPVPTQRSFVLIKPDAVRRGLAGAIISRFESKGLVDRGDGAASNDR